jgi:hypothetical protein
MTMKQLPLALMLTLAGAAAQAAGDADVLRCLEVADGGARLSCYDQVARQIKQARAAGLAAPAVAAMPAETPRVAEQNFGRSAQAVAPSQLSSHIPGAFGGGNPGTRVTLANGQVWTLGEEVVLPQPLKDPKVTVKPGFLGSYFMQIEGLSFQIKVKRLQ